MTKLTYVAFDGARFEVDAENGSTVMENAIRNAVPGSRPNAAAPAPARHAMSMSTKNGPTKSASPRPMEEDMLDFAYDVRPNSRLSCQIKVRDELDGLVVSVPERQG